jgi:DNA polymerase III epsilon subunit family exonuclease
VTEHRSMSFSLISCLGDVPLAFVDVETTGASAAWGDRVIEVGVVRYEGGRVVREYQQLIDPQRRIGAGVVALTGITQDMVTGQPTFEQQLGPLMEALRGAAVLGHNVRFDLSFLRKEFRRARVDICAALANAPVFDTVRIARRRFGRGGNGLQALAPRLGVTPSAAHRALADAQTTAAVFERLMEPVGGWQTCLCDVMREQGGPMNLLPATASESLLPLELEEAIEQRCTVRMEYLDAREQRTERVIKPIQVRRFKGEMTLVAHCHLRNDRRHFKLERIIRLTRIPLEPSSAVITGAGFAPSPGNPGEGWGEGSVSTTIDRSMQKNPHPTLSHQNGRGEDDAAPATEVRTLFDPPIMFAQTGSPASHEDQPDPTRPSIASDGAADRFAADDPGIVSEPQAAARLPD